MGEEMIKLIKQLWSWLAPGRTVIRIDENCIYVDGEEFIAVDSNRPYVCKGCAFDNIDEYACKVAGCAARSREDGRTIIWVAK